MRRIVLASLVLAAVLVPVAASAKLPYFGIEVAPLRPRVGEPITITMTCYHDEEHTIPASACFGAGDSMAWIHPLDRDGDLDRRDWIAVEGHDSASGTIVGRMTLHEVGSYDVLPLWRTWRGGPREGYASVTRIEVVSEPPILTIGAVAFGLVGAVVGAAAWRRRTARTVLSR